ncbi:MAG: T9SS type A sorting domain-containing protein [Ignavibacteriales bacterium]|nr:T9SS type A sorting domain-containing protein [Ignavibacteriales bacterium]
MSSIYKRTFPFLVFFLLLGSQKIVSQALEEVGGPYTKDANTLLLLHFDDNLNNESDFSANGVLHKKGAAGTNQTGFFDNSDMSFLGKCLYLDNDSKSDSSYVTVADSTTLALKGDWTIEGWMNVFTFGDVAGDYRWVPRLCIKTGDVAFWQPNWWVELWGDNRWFQTGFHTADQANWPAVTSAPNVMEPGKWVHLTFIRDNTRKILIQMIHNTNRELIWFGSASYYPTFNGATIPNDTPITTHQAVHIGWAGAEGIPNSSVDSWLHGFVDEIRISNVIRNFPVPPIMTYLSPLPNVDASVVSYSVKATMFPFIQAGSITEAKLKYSIDKGVTWNEALMTKAVGDTFVGAIPKQVPGSIIQYYCTAKDNNGLVAQLPSSGNAPFSFGIYQPNSKMLDLEFEQGIFPILDEGVYNQQVVVHGNVGFSTDAKVGTYSLDFPLGQDTSYLSVDSPFLSTKDFAIDYWFKAAGDTILPYIRMIIRSASGNHVDQNYYIRTEELHGISARYMVDPTVTTRTKNNVDLVMPGGTLTPNKWFHVLYERDDTAAVFELRNENDQTISRLSDLKTAKNPPRPGSSPLRIGWAGNSWDTPPTNRNFMGKMDGIKLYNYAALNLPHNPYTAVENDNPENLPVKYQLFQNYPNPFNPETVIKFAIPKSDLVSLEVYDILGKKVRTLVSEFKSAGKYEIRWNGKNTNGANVTSGIYFYRLKTADYSQIMKMLLLR